MPTEAMRSSSPVKQPHLRFAILAVDVVVLTILNRVIQVLLMPVRLPPDIVNGKALPGGLIRPDETAEEAVDRILAAKCGLSNYYSEQLGTFSRIDRDPSGRVVSVAYLALIPEPAAIEYQLPKGFIWSDAGTVRGLAYDHDDIVVAALDRLRTKLQSTTIARYLLAPKFTLTELQIVYESALGRSLDKRNFRKKLIAGGMVRATGEKLRLAAGRPSELYRFIGRKATVIDILSPS